MNAITHSKTTGWRFDNTYARLSEALYARQNPVPVLEPKIVVFNHALAESLGLDARQLDGDHGAAVFSGNQLPENAEPLAQAYAGHQFGHFTMLGDGRAILLGEQITPEQKRFDVQLKGAGPTSFSRGGDGRAALGPMLREYIISEAMHFLGIPTTRSLAVVSTGEQVYRDTSLPGAILTRIAESHIRVGTFQYLAARGDIETLRAFTRYAMKRHDPELLEADNPYLAFLQSVMERQAVLVAKWQMVGFIHGVVNTDNMAISGETIDYGPCAFMDIYHPATVFSSIDRGGRYAYANQPPIAQWNLARFAETLLPLLSLLNEKQGQEEAQKMAENVILSFPEVFQRHWLNGMRAKLGLFTQESDDATLIERLLTWMSASQADYTNTFRALCSNTLNEKSFFQDEDFKAWYSLWQSRLARQPETPEKAFTLMRTHNPCVIPRNHRVEEALQAAAENNDLTVMENLLTVLKTPYADLPENNQYRLPPDPGGAAYQTFCGT
ncbi:MAG: YdiU family protein [Vampirovibrionales bacterium]|nr:YdiU family protein [Vampirovibrionales bacterium]